MILAYLASPYSHEDEDIRHERFESVVMAAGWMMKNNYHVFSPIAHCHPIQLCYKLPTEFSYWSSYDRRMISHCDALCILQIPGWKESVGVKAEYQIAIELNKPIYLMQPLETENGYSITKHKGENLWL